MKILVIIFKYSLFSSHLLKHYSLYFSFYFSSLPIFYCIFYFYNCYCARSWIKQVILSYFTFYNFFISSRSFSKFYIMFCSIFILPYFLIIVKFSYNYLCSDYRRLISKSWQKTFKLLLYSQTTIIFLFKLIISFCNSAILVFSFDAEVSLLFAF